MLFLLSSTRFNTFLLPLKFWVCSMNFAIYFHSYYGYYVSGGRHKVMGKQGTQNPHLTEFILACVANTKIAFALLLIGSVSSS